MSDMVIYRCQKFKEKENINKVKKTANFGTYKYVAELWQQYSEQAVKKSRKDNSCK